MTDERVISADSHVTLTHDQVKAHLAPKFHEVYDDAMAAFEQRMFKESPSGKANRETMVQYSHPAWGRPGRADPLERLKDMDTDGVDTEVMYCEVSAFRYLYLLKEGWQEATRAFNDALNDFGSVDPKRLVVSYQIPIHDIDHAVSEVNRVAALGGKSLQLPVYPAELGFPDYYDHRYDRLFAAIEDSELPICCHIGINTALDDVTRRDPTPQHGVQVGMVGLMTAEALGMWILGGTLERFPRLKLVFVESGLGWIPFWLIKADDMLQRRGYEFPAITDLPSSYFRRQVAVTFIDEPLAVAKLRHEIGIGNMMWSSDYPHPVSSWPESRSFIERQFGDLPADERAALIGGNAARVWNL